MRRTLALTASAAVVGALALVQSGAAGPGSLGAFFFGPQLVRAEVVMADGTGSVRDYRVDRGRIKAAVPGSLTLLEKDGTTVTVPVAPNADIRFRGRSVPFKRIQRALGAVAITIRQGDQPAQAVQVGQ
jgi:hypothetical protein